MLSLDYFLLLITLKEQVLIWVFCPLKKYLPEIPQAPGERQQYTRIFKHM